MLLCLLGFHCFFGNIDLFSGMHVREDVKLTPGQMHGLSSFNKVTLGIPVSINIENAEALTAVPGIGPKTARRIVQRRNKTGGFRQLEDLKSIPGVGPALFSKIEPFLSL